MTIDDLKKFPKPVNIIKIKNREHSVWLGANKFAMKEECISQLKVTKEEYDEVGEHIYRKRSDNESAEASSRGERVRRDDVSREAISREGRDTAALLYFSSGTRSE